MSRIFSCCKILSELNLSSFNTNDVTDMSGMFKGYNNFSDLNYHYLILIM